MQGFADRFGEHLKTGVIGWLTGTLGSAGITLPATFDLMGVLDLARQILGLTWERLRAKAVKLIGEQNVARLEFIGGYITTLGHRGLVRRCGPRSWRTSAACSTWSSRASSRSCSNASCWR